MGYNEHSIFILENGSVKGCGGNSYGQLGIGNTTNQTSIIDISINNVKQITGGGYHTMFLLENGTVKCCGLNSSGELGIGSTTNQTSIVDVPITNGKQMACG